MNEKALSTRQSIAIASGHFCSSRYCSGNPQVIVILKVVEGYLQQQVSRMTQQSCIACLRLLETVNQKLIKLICFTLCCF